MLSQEIAPGIFCANSIINIKRPFVKFINTTEHVFVLPKSFLPIFELLKNFYYVSIKETNNNTNNNRNQKFQEQIAINT